MVALPGEPGPSLEYRRELPFSWRVIHDRYQQGRSRRQGTLVAIIEGVKAVEVSSILRKLPRQARHRVLEITLDMSSTMHAIARECFPNAEQVIDRFHVQKLACDALQELRKWKTPGWRGGSTGRENSVTGKPGKRYCSVPGCYCLKTRRPGT